MTVKIARMLMNAILEIRVKTGAYVKTWTEEWVFIAFVLKIFLVNFVTLKKLKRNYN